MEEELKVNFTGFKSQLKDAQRELEILIQQTGEFSDASVAAAKRVAGIRDQMDDAKDAVKAFTGAGKFEAVTKSLQSVAGGFTAVQGAIGLVSGDSEELAASMQKLQSAMALTQGLTAVEDMGRSFKQLGTSAKAALGGIKSGIVATGIGLFIVALGTVVAYWDDIREAVIKAIPALKSTEEVFYKIKEVASGVGNVVLNFFKNIGESVGKLFKGDIKGALNDLREGIQIADAYEKGAAEQRVENQKDRDNKLLEGQIKAKEKRIEVLKAEGKATYALELQTLKDKQKLYAEDKEKLAEVNQEIAVLQASHRKELNDKAKAASDEQAKIADEKTKEIAKITADAAFEATKLGKSELEKQKIDIEENYRERLALIEKGSQAEKDLLALKQAEIDAATKKFNEDEAQKEKDKKAKELSDKEKALTEANNLEILSAKKTITDKEALDAELNRLEIQKLEGQIALKKQYGESTTELEIALADKSTAINAEKNAKQKADDEAALQAKTDIINAELDLMGQVGSIISALAGENKKAQIAGLVIEQAGAVGKIIANTALANAKSVAASPVTAGMPWVAINTASAALSIGSVVAGVAKSIQEINSSGGDGGGSAAGGSSGAKFAEGGLLSGPSHGMGGIKTALGELEGGEFVINKNSTASFLPLIEAINSAGNGNSEPMNSGSAPSPIFKTYVVASEMSSQQEADKRVNDLARL